MPDAGDPLLNNTYQLRLTEQDKRRLFAACKKKLTHPSIVLRALAIAYADAVEQGIMPEPPFEIRGKRANGKKG